MLDRVMNRLRRRPAHACFCTLAVHPPYRRRAQLLLADTPTVPWIVFTDQPDEFAGLARRVVRHAPTGPMAIDFRTTLPPTGSGQGRPAYHDKRFVLQAALEDFDTAIFIDADTRVRSLPRLPAFRPGIAVDKGLRASIAEHLTRWGPSRRGAFEQLALHLTGDVTTLESARWCSEALFAVTKDGHEARFFEAWGTCAEFLHGHGVFTGEGGAIGLAAACAGWAIDYRSLVRFAAATEHEGHGPKSS
jgi:hypothetical protein